MPEAQRLRLQELGINAGRLADARSRLLGWTEAGSVPAFSVCLGRRGGMAEPFAVGTRDDLGGSPAVEAETTFLVASLTKPLTAMAMLLLVERGQALLDDTVESFFPEFTGPGRSEIQIRHLLTHTSGLPDMLPENAALRTRHAAPDEFFREVCQTPLLFSPGSEVRYQSMGFLVLDRIVQKVSGQSLPQFLKAEFFEPLGMTRTSLGADKAGLTNHASIRISEEARNTDWHWNSAYWLGFGAAWGGLITTASDYARFLAMMLGGGTWRGVRILSPASVDAATRNQLRNISGLGETWVARYPWGLGWRLSWPGRSTFFGDLLSPSSFGHWGSTGTIAWVDPERDAFAVILTSLPQDPHGRFLALASNLLASCFE